MTFLAYLTFVVAGITQIEPVAPVGTPQECCTVALFRIKERAVELNRPLSDFKMGCTQATFGNKP